MEKPPKTWGPGKEFFWHKNSPPVRRNRLSLRKDLRFEKTAVEIFSSRLELFLGKCHEIPDAQKRMTSWWSKHLVFEQSIRQIGNMSRKNNIKNLWENTTWMMT